MYLDYFGLSQKPFLITPDPAFLYPSAGHQQALAHLRYGLQREGGFVLLTGEVGTGKTTLCRLLIGELPADFRLAYVLNAGLDSAATLAGICRELSIPVEKDASVNDLAILYDDLLVAHGANRHTLVVIEEAQNLAPDVLETLRLLTNLETCTTKLLHILLVGQPELLSTLAQPGLRQLKQRVVSRSHLGPLTRPELTRYLRHRLAVAGREQRKPLFTTAAAAAVHRNTGGVPRLVNLLAEHCLIGAYAIGQKRIGVAVVRRAARELFAGGGSGGWRRRRQFAAGLTLTLAVGGAAWWWLAMQGALNPAAGPPPQLPGVVEEAPQAPHPGDTPALHSETVPAASAHHPGAFAVLLQAWGIATEAGSIEEACAAASAASLRCRQIVIDSPADLAALGTPVVASLRMGSDRLEYAAISAVSANEWRVENARGAGQFPAQDVLERLVGNSTMIWQPPPGFDGPLFPGSLNPPLVAAVRAALDRAGYLDEGVVTGGRYSEFLASTVKRYQSDRGLAVDGIVGFETLFSLMAESPRLEGAG